MPELNILINPIFRFREPLKFYFWDCAKVVHEFNLGVKKGKYSLKCILKFSNGSIGERVFFG